MIQKNTILAGVELQLAGLNMFIDSHCHLDLIQSETLDQLLANASEAGVTAFVIPGLQSSQWPQIKRLSEQYTQLYFSVGLHPWWIEQELTRCEQGTHISAHLQDHLKHYLHHPKCVGIGECGLDGHIDTPMALQEDILDCQLKLAIAISKPVILHSRKTHHILLNRLKKQNAQQRLRGVLHGFSGSKQQAALFLQQGISLGIGGTITYDRAKKTRATVQTLPIESLVLETDSPDMPLAGFQGQDNTPAQLPRVAQELALLRKESLATIANQTSKNARVLFNMM